MQPRIERKWPLMFEFVSTRSVGRDKNQVPALGRNCAGDDDKGMRPEESVSELLLACARGARPEPIWIGNAGRLNDVNPSGIH